MATWVLVHGANNSLIVAIGKTSGLIFRSGQALDVNGTIVSRASGCSQSLEMSASELSLNTNFLDVRARYGRTTYQGIRVAPTNGMLIQGNVGIRINSASKRINFGQQCSHRLYWHGSYSS